MAPGSAAERAGIRPTAYDDEGRLRLGDVIVAVDGQKVASNDDLVKILDKRKVGDQVTITVTRDEKKTELALTLQAL